MTTELTGRSAAGSARRGLARTTSLSKVPEVTLIFWITKILTTGMGETTSDFLNQKWDPKIMVSLSGLVLAGVIWVQFRAPRYSAWLYWAAVVMVSVFGTMCADVLHVAFGVPYAVSTVFFAVALVAIFVLWYRVEGTLSIHSITTPRRELFYWLTVVTTFALGTAVGDLTATTLKLGYFSSGVMFAVLFAVPAVAYRFGLNGDLRVLVRLRRDPAVRRVVRRLDGRVGQARRPGLGDRAGQPGAAGRSSWRWWRSWR